MTAAAKKIYYLCLGGLLLNPALCRAENPTPIDISFQSGLAVGTVTKLQVDGKKQTFLIGGVPFGLTWNHDVEQRWSTALSGEILLDIVNRQMIRQGLTGAVAYHVFGGARRLDRPGEAIHITSTNSFNLSLVARAGLFNYAASDPKSLTNNLVGGVWEIASGFEYRKEISDTSSAGISALVTLTTLPASVERLSSRTSELLVFWRRFF